MGAEIIDHHRLGALNTAQPILFINEPVGSTCTIVADLFRRDGLLPSPEVAGIMIEEHLVLRGLWFRAKAASTVQAGAAGTNPR